MSTKKIITDKNVLSEWASEIDTRKEGKLLQEIVLSLKETMRENDLRSLSAPQIGYDKRVFCMRFGDSDYRTFVNPAIENNSGISMTRETCSSIPDKNFIIPRFSKIKFYFTTPLGKIETATLVGQAAYVFQHCMDHLCGMLVDDIGLEIDEMFDNASPEEQEEVLRLYAESLDLRQKQLDKEVQDDKELKDIDDAAKFIHSVKDGTTILEVDETKKDNNEEK